MKIVKKLNNNVAIGIDNNNHECIIFGKGVGFPAMPYELNDLSKINRTYYDIDEKYLGLVEEIPDEIFSVASKIVEIAKIKLNCDLNPNLLFTLADHLNFAIERYEKNIDLSNPLFYDIEHFYSKEISIGYKALEYIQQELKLHLPKSEAANIAMHLVNAEANDGNMNESIRNTKVLRDVVDIISETLQIEIEEESYSYSRFIIHMRYLLNRHSANLKISSENKKMYELMKVQYPDTYKCVIRIEEYFSTHLGWQCDEEELLYLMLHINRLCV